MPPDTLNTFDPETPFEVIANQARPDFGNSEDAPVDDEVSSLTSQVQGEDSNEGKSESLAQNSVFLATYQFVSELLSSESPTPSTPTLATSDTQDILSESEQQVFFSALSASLDKPESLTIEEGAPSPDRIQAALMENPAMMRNLYNLQNNGAELVITYVNKDGSILLADAALDMNIKKQEAALKALTEGQKNSAIETILAPIPDDEREEARTWFLAQLKRPENATGFNLAEAFLYAVAHGGTLISHKLYDAIAKRDASVYESQTWTWYFEQLSTVISSGLAPYGDRYWGEAARDEDVAGDRDDLQGGRVAGLRVQIP
jgi:hypothetical protein